MQISRQNINCSLHWQGTLRKELFSAVKYTFSYTDNATDQFLLDSLIEKGKRLAAKVNHGAANDAALSRPFQKVVNNCIAGTVSEFCWKHFLNDGGKINRVSETPFTGAAAQIDLNIITTNQTIEVRSSFPRNGIPFAICHPQNRFDIIGPYNNIYKPGEPKKDLYVRALFHLRKKLQTSLGDNKTSFSTETIINKIYGACFEVYLTGGATHLMMNDEKISKIKSLIPEDEMDMAKTIVESEYRVVPFEYALDTIEIHQMVKNMHLK